MSSSWEIYALKYADHVDRQRHDSFIFDDNHDSALSLDYYIWLLKNGDKTILVDTGFDAAESTTRGRRLLEEPADLLKRFGVSPDTIDTVIITHMHYDHAGSLPDFSHATFHLQEQEMSYATGPCMCHDALRKPYTGDHVCAMVKQLFSGRLKFYNGTGLVAPGVEVHLIGGHSRGLQCVRVMTQRGWVVLASDASHYYENFLAKKPFPIVVDIENMLKGFDNLTHLAESIDHVIPGHDPLVGKYYPKAFDGDNTIMRLDVDPLSRINPTMYQA